MINIKKLHELTKTACCNFPDCQTDHWNGLDCGTCCASCKRCLCNPKRKTKAKK